MTKQTLEDYIKTVFKKTDKKDNKGLNRKLNPAYNDKTTYSRLEKGKPNKDIQ